MAETRGTGSLIVDEQRDIGGWLRDQTQLLVDRSLSSPLGFLAAVATLILAGSIGFLVAVVVMPWWMLRRRKYLGAFGATILFVCVLVAAIAPLLQTVEQDPDAVRVAPYIKASFSERFTAPNAEHVMGTDNQGRDIVTRIIYGSEVTVLVGFGSVIATAVLSTMIGVVSGYFAGVGMSWSMRGPRRLIGLPTPFWWFACLPFAAAVFAVQLLFKLADLATLNLFSERIEDLSDHLLGRLPSRAGRCPMSTWSSSASLTSGTPSPRSS